MTVLRAETTLRTAGDPLAPIVRALTGPRFLLVLLAAGLAVRFWQYAAATSLWLDEIALSRNILGLPLADLLFQPLAFDQVAPRGFLLAVRLVTSVFGGHELALRLLPFICGVLAMVLFWRLATSVLDGVGAPFAVAIFAIGFPFVKYSAEVKQYGIDIAAAIALTLSALRLRERDHSGGQVVLAGLAGLLVVWFSQAAVLVMSGLGPMPTDPPPGCRNWMSDPRISVVNP